MMPACLLLLALTAVVPAASAPHERTAPAETSVGATSEEPTLVAHRRQSAATDRP